MSDLKRILLAEDDPNDVELTLTALAEYNLANEVHVVKDGRRSVGLPVSTRGVCRPAGGRSGGRAAGHQNAQSGWGGGVAAD